MSDAPETVFEMLADFKWDISAVPFALVLWFSEMIYYIKLEREGVWKWNGKTEK